MLAAHPKPRVNLGCFDLVKGIGIIIVILSHTFAHLNYEQSPGLHLMNIMIECAKAGMMPMFFMISGFGFAEKKPTKMLKKTFSDLIIPYLLVMVGYALIFPLAYYRPAYGGWIEPTIIRTVQYVVAFIFGFGPIGTTIFGFETAWCTAAWYLLATFVAFNILNLVVKIENTAAQIACVILCAIIGGILFKLGFVFYCIPQGFMAVGYCYVGYILRKHNLLRYIQSSFWTYLVLIPFFIAELIWGFFDLSQGLFNNIICDYIGAGCSGALFMFAGVFLGQCEWRCFDWIKAIGAYSYWIFAVHAVEMEALPWWYWERPLEEHQWLALILELILKIGIYILACFLIKKISIYKYRRKIASKKK